MATHAQNVISLADTIQRIAEGEDFIRRTEGLIERARERGEDTVELRKYLADMQMLLEQFRGQRDKLLKIIEAADSRSLPK